MNAIHVLISTLAWEVAPVEGSGPISKTAIPIAFFFKIRKNPSSNVLKQRVKT
jgi:hypothetical protein